MKRTIAVAFTSGLLASAAMANIGTSMLGEAYLTAGDLTDNGSFGVPSIETFLLGGEPGTGTPGTIVKIVTGETSDTVSFDFTVTTAGTSPNLGGADVIISFILTEAANFTLTGNLEGLTFFQSTIEGNDNPFILVDELLYDEFSGFSGSLANGGTPVENFLRQGILDAGEYTFVLSSYSEAAGGDNDFFGQGSAILALQAIPAPAGALALAMPGLLIARRRRA